MVTITNAYLVIGLKENTNATDGYKATGSTPEEVMYGFRVDGDRQVASVN